MAMLPLYIRRLYIRTKWFLSNYNKIEFNTQLFNDIYGPPTYNTDGLATSTNSDFINDQKFAKAYHGVRNEKKCPTCSWPRCLLFRSK